VRGDLLLAGGDHAAAEKNYYLAFTVARRQSAKLEELRAAMSMARLWRDQGKRSEARDLLARVCAWFNGALTRSICRRPRLCLTRSHSSAELAASR
jgi:hypothetical protein